MKKLIFNAIIPIGPNRINCDEEGNVKRVFDRNGQPRQFVSSQCIKHAIMSDCPLLDFYQYRITEHIDTLSSELKSFTEEEAKKIATIVMKQIYGFEAKSNEIFKIEKLAYKFILNYCNSNVEKIKKELAGKEKKTYDFVDDLKKEVEEAKSVFIILFGRMCASESSKTVNGSDNFSPAISISSTTFQNDYFTATSFYEKKENAGAVHLGNRNFSTGAELYKSFFINIDDENKDMLKEFFSDREIVELFIKALGHGGENNFSGIGAPAYFSMAIADTRLASGYVSFLDKDYTVEEAIAKIKHQLEYEVGKERIVENDYSKIVEAIAAI